MSPHLLSFDWAYYTAVALLVAVVQWLRHGAPSPVKVRPGTRWRPVPVYLNELVTPTELGTTREVEVDGARYTVRIPRRLGRDFVVPAPGTSLESGRPVRSASARLWPVRQVDPPRVMWMSDRALTAGARVRLRAPWGVMTHDVPPATPSGSVRVLARDREGDGAHEFRFELRGYDARLRPAKVPPGSEIDSELAAARARSAELRAMLPESLRQGPTLSPAQVTAQYAIDGWVGVFRLLYAFLGLHRYNIGISVVESVEPGVLGQCVLRESRLADSVRAQVTVPISTTVDPFLFASTIAHELCHVIHAHWVESVVRASKFPIASSRSRLRRGTARTVDERDVDFLVCELGLGIFAILSRQTCGTFPSYLRPEVFDRLVADATHRIRASAAGDSPSGAPE
ncbi:MAG: hypothetical protein JNM10_01355 [Planctomycetia bacterium]|nr:hypothetical protein [Planctomycetia bacterium]